MRFTFLHLSDLHHRGDRPESVDLVRGRLFEDLPVLCKEHSDLYLAFTGDLVLAGADAALYQEFHEQFARRLEDLGIPRARRFVIPGNHDVSQMALKPVLAMQMGTIGVIKDESQFNDALSSFEPTVLRPKFENYMRAESAFADFTCCTNALGGRGWDLPSGLGVYCLNTAMCSFGGLTDHLGKPITDRGSLMIDTRSLYRWLNETNSTTRVLLMHHPLEWLADWARSELSKIIAASFSLVLSGHVHEGSSTFSSHGEAGKVHCVAPPLFTSKEGLLGYAFIELDSETGDVDVHYRQWTPGHKFVAGTSFANNDRGTVSFRSKRAADDDPLIAVPAPKAESVTTVDVLTAEFDDATTCYSSKRRLWVDRDLSPYPETVDPGVPTVILPAMELARSPKSCQIRAPRQYGLSALGRYLAWSPIAYMWMEAVSSCWTPRGFPITRREFWTG